MKELIIDNILKNWDVFGIHTNKKLLIELNKFSGQLSEYYSGEHRHYLFHYRMVVDGRHTNVNYIEAYEKIKNETGY